MRTQSAEGTSWQALLVKFKGYPYPKDVIVWTARVVLGGIELVHTLRKGQLASAEGDAPMTAAEALYLLAA